MFNRSVILSGSEGPRLQVSGISHLVFFTQASSPLGVRLSAVEALLELSGEAE